MNVNFVIQALNIHNLNEFVDWIVQKPKIQTISSVIVYFPKGTSPLYLPIEYRKPYLEKVLNNKNLDHPMFAKTFKNQVQHLYNSDEELPMTEFIHLNMLYDQNRKQHLYKVIPQLKKYTDKFITNIGKSSRLKPRLINHYVDMEV